VGIIAASIALAGCTSTPSGTTAGTSNSSPSPPGTSAPANPEAEPEAENTETPEPTATALDSQQVSNLLVTDQAVDEAFPNYSMKLLNLGAVGPATRSEAEVVRPADCRPVIDGPLNGGTEDSNGPIDWLVVGQWTSGGAYLADVAVFQEVALYPTSDAAEEVFTQFVDARQECESYSAVLADGGTLNAGPVTVDYDPGDEVLQAWGPGEASIYQLVDSSIVSISVVQDSAGKKSLTKLRRLLDRSVANVTAL
jgi:hypothetical protein